MQISHCCYSEHVPNQWLKTYNLEYTAYRGRSQPAKSLLQVIHIFIERIEKSIAKKMIFSKVKLSSSVVIALIIPFSGEVKPFWMSKFVTCV